MRVMGEQFVCGETIEAALHTARKLEAQGFRYSYDMLGEAAATARDAARYLASYDAGAARHRRRLGRARHLRGAGPVDQALGVASALSARRSASA